MAMIMERSCYGSIGSATLGEVEGGYNISNNLARIQPGEKRKCDRTRGSQK